MIRSTIEGALTADQQIARMRDDYPGLTVLQAEPWIILWRGWLTPYAQPYEVQLLYCAISLPLAGVDANTVHVEVVQPLLGRRPADPSTPVPHIWSNRVMPNRPRLCLHKESEWTPAMHVADTIVPWTIEWLAAYEGWRATGTWYAGGHNTEREDLCRPRRRQQ